MLSIDLNCDLGEGFPHDALIMPFISSVNIACGYHAGDQHSIVGTIELALRHQVAIGAHPSYADRENFGRKVHTLSAEGYYELITAQLEIMQKAAATCGARLHHVKPHGALYNTSARNKKVANSIAKAVYDFDSTLILYGLSGSDSIGEAKRYKLRTASEVFADRTYQSDGSLTPRDQDNSLVAGVDQMLRQVLQMITTQTVTSINSNSVPIKAETLCIHGDGKHAVEFVKDIRHLLDEHQFAAKAL
jgi:UPF0271 protein